MSNEIISSSEFQRFQDQLISLKEAKYKSEEKCEYLMRNISQLESKCALLEQELMTVNDLKNKFRSAKDMDILMKDNQILRDRLSTIEMNFKLQNDIIRTECENLFSENERLKSQMETYKSLQNNSNNMVNINDNISSNNDITDSPSHQDNQYKIRCLQHEITKLLQEKTNVENENNILKSDISRLKQVETELVSRINDLLNEKNRLGNLCATMKNEYDLVCSIHGSEMENLEAQCEKRIELQSQDYDVKLIALQKELDNENMKQNQQTTKTFEEKIHKLIRKNEELEIELSNKIQETMNTNEHMKQEHENKLFELIYNYEEKLKEKQLQIEAVEQKNLAELERIKNNNFKLQTNLDYMEEELKLSNRKNQKIMKDVKKQLEKEVKLTQEAQSKLEEAVSVCSQNSQAKTCEYLIGSSNNKFVNSDDQSSIYSSSNNGLNFEAQWTPNSISMTDDELKKLLDRFAGTQNDLCESKRYIEALTNNKSELVKTIERQQNIILNYIKNRGCNDTTDSGLTSPKRDHSTSEALVLNGMMNSSSNSNFGLQSLVNKVKDSLRSISTDSLSFGDKDMCRVTTAEVKQLQRVCEELMMRCLNLETDLQFALDLNTQLRAQLGTIE